jgi:hypothetical protein
MPRADSERNDYARSEGPEEGVTTIIGTLRTIMFQHWHADRSTYR